MKYISTRGNAPELDFEDVLLTGLAEDGGLYVPQEWPTFSADELRAMRGKSYCEIALMVMRPFLGNAIPDDTLKAMVEQAYSTFAHPAVAPLKQLNDNDWLLELFHGPTLAFKDVAMQILGHMMDYVLNKRGQRATIVGATSGDTGGAAIEAFRGRDAVDIFIMFPHNKVSDVQRRQMTTVLDHNVHNIALEGTFDDCQNMLKAMFNHRAFRSEIALAGVNSINWARVMAQSVYYFTSAIALGAPDRSISYCVPTGNFGDILAGYVAKRMGLPVHMLTAATNSNDILARTMETGRYEMSGVVATTSPSMDIQVSSNFERLLFDSVERDSNEVVRMMSGLQQSGSFTIPQQAYTKLKREFNAGRADEQAVSSIIATTLDQTGELLDPHTAVGVQVAQNIQRDHTVPMVTLSTAHPAKFPDAVMAASGIHPNLPERLADLAEREERYDILSNDQDLVENFISARSRAAQ
ncbi:MAG: threonine synthase [Hyphomicrobiales bacterium]